MGGLSVLFPLIEPDETVSLTIDNDDEDEDDNSIDDDSLSISAQTPDEDLGYR